MKAFVKNYAKSVIIVSVTFLVIFIGSNVIFGTTNPFYVVSSKSMTPVLNVGDVIIVQKNISFDKIKTGDIIAFVNPGEHNEIIVHRVVQMLTQDPLQMRTKGDANYDSIPGVDMPITENEYVGKVMYVIPHLGYVKHVLNPPTNYVIAIAMLGIIAVNFSSMHQLKKSSST